MAQYDFECPECKTIETMMFSMNDDEGRKNAKCPTCKGKLKRIYSVPNAMIKSNLSDSIKTMGPTQNFVDVDGQPIKMNFIDNGPASYLDSNSVAANIPGAHIDEATGKPCVSILSNQPDPLGKIEEAKQRSMAEGLTQIEKKEVNTKVKTRK